MFLIVSTAILWMKYDRNLINKSNFIFSRLNKISMNFLLKYFFSDKSILNQKKNCFSSSVIHNIYNVNNGENEDNMYELSVSM